MATSATKNNVTTAKENKAHQQNTKNAKKIIKYSYFFSQIDNIYRPYKTYFTTNILYYVEIGILLFFLGFGFSAWFTYNHPYLSGLNSQLITEIQQYYSDAPEDASKPDGLSLCGISQIESVLSSLQGPLSLDKARTLEACVAMETIIGDNDPINILSTLIGLQATLAIAIAFTEAKDKKTVSQKIASLSFIIYLFAITFSGATIWSTLNKYKIWGVVLNITLLLVSYCLVKIGNLTNSDYTKDIHEWEKRLKDYRAIYQQIITKIPYRNEQLNKQSNVKNYTFSIYSFSIFISIVHRIDINKRKIFIKLMNNKHILFFYIALCEFIYSYLMFSQVKESYLLSNLILSVLFTIASTFFFSYPAEENDVLYVLNKKIKKEKKNFFPFSYMVFFASISFNLLFIPTLWVLSSSPSLFFFVLILFFHILWIISLFKKHDSNWLFLQSRLTLLTKDIDNMDKELKYLHTIKNYER